MGRARTDPLVDGPLKRAQACADTDGIATPLACLGLLGQVARASAFAMAALVLALLLYLRATSVTTPSARPATPRPVRAVASHAGPRPRLLAELIAQLRVAP